LRTGTREYTTEPGKEDIPAKGSIRLEISGTMYTSHTVKKVTLRRLTLDEFLSSFTPTGKEYDEYTAKAGAMDPARQ